VSPGNSNYSNNIIIDKTKCNFCGICVDRCILDNLRLQLSPCRQACPVGQNCQAYIQEFARGGLEKAGATIWQTAPLAGVLGRICSHPCESVCSRSRADGQPVAIRALKRFIVDHLDRPEPDTPSGQSQQRVAIVGSGPAGLMAAWELRRMGYQVTIYEKESRPGGNLTSVIPEFRLPLEVVLDEIAWIERWGVKIETGICMGRDISLDQLTREADSVLVAAGASQNQHLEVPGENASNVYSATSFLKRVKNGNPPSLGSSTLIIGGGNSAVDAAQTAKRLGVEQVGIVCLERTRGEMAAYPWAIDEVLEEGINIEWGWGPCSFADTNGKTVNVDCQRCLRVLEDECFLPLLDPGTQKRFEADSFIVAIGEKVDENLFKQLNSLAPADAEFRVDALTQATPMEGLFVAGDTASGPSSVVDAMASGKRAAISIDRYLRGEDLRYGRSYAGPYITDFSIDLQAANSTVRQESLKIKGGERLGFKEIDGGFDESMATAESSRCLNCGAPVACFDSCWYCLPCEVSCPEDALRVEIPYKIR